MKQLVKWGNGAEFDELLYNLSEILSDATSIDRFFWLVSKIGNHGYLQSLAMFPSLKFPLKDEQVQRMSKVFGHRETKSIQRKSAMIGFLFTLSKADFPLALKSDLIHKVSATEKNR